MYASNSQHLRNSIKKYMADNNLTMRSLGKKAGIHHNSISRILSGTAKVIQVETLQKLEAVGVRFDSDLEEAWKNFQANPWGSPIPGESMSEASRVLFLYAPLLRLLTKTREVNDIMAWVKSPAGQRVFCPDKNETIALLLVYLYRKGLLHPEMPDLPDFPSPSA